ncbi:MAG: hypothetical protein ACO1G7_09970 [Bacteroidota bacterium]|jgi:hypothetical protein|nr:hypothetical protein [Bacteroidia bacterium]
MSDDLEQFGEPEGFDPEFGGYFEEEGEEWKTRPLYGAWQQACAQWETVQKLLEAALEGLAAKAKSGDTAVPVDTLTEEQLHASAGDNPHLFLYDHALHLLGEAMCVSVKLEVTNACLYIIRMENASEIRARARTIQASLLLFAAEGLIQRSYIDAIRREINTFRHAFRAWVQLFEKDEFEDEWGLYV